MIITSSIYEGKSLKDSRGFDKKLNKTVKLNSTNRLIFRTIDTYDPETGDIIPNRKAVIAPIVPGYSCDWNVCGTSFYPLADGQFTYNPETRECTDLSGLKEWARICAVLHKASEINDKYEARARIESNAARIGASIDQASLNDALTKIEVEYRGGKDILGNKINPTKSPIISNIQLKMTTQCLVIPMSKEGTPLWEEAETAYVELSKEKMDSLIDLLTDPKYNGGDSGYLEVEYKYSGTDAKEAGRKAKFNGITRDNSLEVCFPESYAANGQRALAKLVEGQDVNQTAELIAGRNVTLRASKTVKDLEASIRAFCSKERGVIASIDIEDEETKKVAKQFLNLGLADEVPKIKESLSALIETVGESTLEQIVTEADAREQAVMSAVSELGTATNTAELASSAIDIDALNTEFEEDDM